MILKLRGEVELETKIWELAAYESYWTWEEMRSFKERSMDMHKKWDQIQSLRNINTQGDTHTMAHEGGGQVECTVMEIKKRTGKKDGGIKENMPGILALSIQFLRRHLLLLVACVPEIQGFTAQKDLSARGLLLPIWVLMALRQTLIESIMGDQELSTSSLHHCTCSLLVTVVPNFLDLVFYASSR